MVVSGTTKVKLGEIIKNLTVNESICVPSGTKHRLINPEEKPLILIEVQSVSYVGEDVIIRIEDN